MKKEYKERNIKENINKNWREEICDISALKNLSLVSFSFANNNNVSKMYICIYFIKYLSYNIVHDIYIS